MTKENEKYIKVLESSNAEYEKQMDILREENLSLSKRIEEMNVVISTYCGKVAVAQANPSSDTDEKEGNRKHKQLVLKSYFFVSAFSLVFSSFLLLLITAKSSFLTLDLLIFVISFNAYFCYVLFIKSIKILFGETDSIKASNRYW